MVFNNNKHEVCMAEPNMRLYSNTYSDISCYWRPVHCYQPNLRSELAAASTKLIQLKCVLELEHINHQLIGRVEAQLEELCGEPTYTSHQEGTPIRVLSTEGFSIENYKIAYKV